MLGKSKNTNSSNTNLKKMKLLTCQLFLLFFLPIQNPLFSQKLKSADSSSKVAFGAYYFDGWRANSNLITKSLVDSFSERKPVWGWVTSTQKIVDAQIIAASGAGLSFFSFCWYYDEKVKLDSINQALSFYNRSTYKNKLKYCLMVANHSGYEITPENWKSVQKEWIANFKSSRYLTVDNKPLLIFFSVGGLVKRFGSVDLVKAAFESFRKAAVNAGLKGVEIAGCVSPFKEEVKIAEQCGFDILTGYNYHGHGLLAKMQKTPIDSMQKADYRCWSLMPALSKLPYIPVTTLNWDPRPWRSPKDNSKIEPYFIGFSTSSVFKSVMGVRTWISHNSAYTPTERIALLYAWNEYGEGAYLTPTKVGINPLIGVKRAIKAK
jgi:hypothetical protein